jgi:hypothetical protein
MDVLRITRAADEAVAELVNAGTDEADVWTPALAGATWEKSLLVRRLDRFDGYYFIVSYLKNGIVSARFAVDAETTDIEEIGAIEKAGQYLPTFAEPSAVLARLAALTPDDTRLSGVRFQIRPELITVPSTPALGWKNCLESRSQLLPFYIVTVGDQPVYVRVDGEVFPALNNIADA